MRLYLYRHFFLFATMSTILFGFILILGGFPFGYSLFLNAILWGGLIGVGLLHLYFRHRNLWILYFNFQIHHVRLILSAYFIFTIALIGLVLLTGEAIGL